MSGQGMRLLRMAVNDRIGAGSYADLAERAGVSAKRLAALMDGRPLRDDEAARLWACLMDWSWQ